VERLGIDFFANVVALEVYEPNDDVLRRLNDLPHLSFVTIHGTHLAAAGGLAERQQLPPLPALGAPYDQAKDARDMSSEREEH
jgi:hypothetical protein